MQTLIGVELNFYWGLAWGGAAWQRYLPQLHIGRVVTHSLTLTYSGSPTHRADPYMQSSSSPSAGLVEQQKQTTNKYCCSLTRPLFACANFLDTSKYCATIKDATNSDWGWS